MEFSYEQYFTDKFHNVSKVSSLYPSHAIATTPGKSVNINSGTSL